jgi:hypothetical protein
LRHDRLLRPTILVFAAGHDFSGAGNDDRQTLQPLREFKLDQWQKHS